MRIFFPHYNQIGLYLEVLRATVAFGPLLCQIISRKDTKQGVTI